MKILLVWFIVLIGVFCPSYVHAADPILIRTGCFDFSLTYGVSLLDDEDSIHWIKIINPRIKEAIVKLRFSVQDADGLEKSELLIPNDKFNGHTIYFSKKYVKFLVEVMHNREILFATEYIEFLNN